MHEQILSVWLEEMKKINKLPWMARLANGDMKLCHYKGYLLETYHNTGYNPQRQAFATMYIKDNPREIVELFYKHAISEIAHDLLALNDLVALGEDREKLIATKPLPETAALNAFVINQIQFENPIAYLGYLFHLEFLPTSQGKNIIADLRKIGVPEEAVTFIKEHASVDVGHNNMMKIYINKLVKTDKDYDDFIYALKSTCKLHYNMVAASCENGEIMFNS